MHKLISWMGIKRGEGKLVVLSIFYTLLFGLSQAWLYTIPITLFLTHFNTTTLPYAYIASAIVLVILGMVYSAVEKKWAPTHLLYTFIILPAVAFFVLWIFLQTTSSKWLYLILFVCSAAVSDLINLELWATLNCLFTLDQAKRLFGTIGACETLAGIIGSLLIPLLFVWIGLNHIILGVSICLMCATFLLNVIFRKHPKRFSHLTTEKNRDNTPIQWRGNSYLTNTMLLALFGSLIYIIVEILFYNVNKIAFPTEVQLASFLGIFFAISNGLDVLCNGLVGPLIINRLGIKSALVFRFMAVGSTTLVLLLLLPLHLSFHSIFLLVALIKLLDEGIHYSIFHQATLILYQPLSQRLRVWLQHAIELCVCPLSIILASILFIFIQAYFSLNLALITVLILIITALALWIIFSLQKGYVDHLTQAISKQLLVFHSQIVDKNSATFLLEKLRCGKPHEIVYCLDLLEKADPSYFAHGLEFCLAHPHALIKQAALIRLQHVHADALTPTIKKIVMESADPILQTSACCALLFQKALDLELQSYIDSKDVVLSDGAILAALKYSSNSPFQQRARERLHTLIHSTSSHERLRAVRILGQLEHEAIPDLLLLFEDRDPSVVIAVIEQLPAFQENSLYQKLAQTLRRDELRLPATRAFIQAKDRGLPALTEALQHQDPYPLVTIIGYLQTPAAAQLLLQILRTPIDHALQWHILHALDHCGYQAMTTAEKQQLSPLLREVIDHLRRLLNWARQVSNYPGQEQLFSTLMRHIQSTQQHIFLILGLLYPKHVIHDIAFYFKHEDLDKVSYAHELLEHILEHEHKNILVPLFKECHSDALLHPQFPLVPDRKNFHALDSDFSGQQSAELDGDLNQIVESERKVGLENLRQVHENFCGQARDIAALFQEILAYPQTPLLKATILYLIARHRLTQLIHCILTAVNDQDEMVSETATWALTHLENEHA